MLRKLHISNFALIEELKFEPNQGFIAITGENVSTKRLLQSLADHNSLLALLTELGFFKHEKDIDSSISVSN